MEWIPIFLKKEKNRYPPPSLAVMWIVNFHERKPIQTKNDSLWIILATRRNGHVVTFFCSWPEVKMRQNGKFHFRIPLNRATFFLRAVQSHPVSLSYATDVSQNYIPLSLPHYLHHTKYVQKVDKPMIYAIIGSESESW